MVNSRSFSSFDLETMEDGIWGMSWPRTANDGNGDSLLSWSLQPFSQSEFELDAEADEEDVTPPLFACPLH